MATYQKIGRINERNIGNWSLEGQPKQRKESIALTDEEKRLVLIVLHEVYECLEYDPDLSEVGHLNPEARFSDGGRVLLNFSRKSFESIGSAISKLQKNGKW